MEIIVVNPDLDLSLLIFLGFVFIMESRKYTAVEIVDKVITLLKLLRQWIEANHL